MRAKSERDWRDLTAYITPKDTGLRKRSPLLPSILHTSLSTLQFALPRDPELNRTSLKSWLSH